MSGDIDNVVLPGNVNECVVQKIAMEGSDSVLSSENHVILGSAENFEVSIAENEEEANATSSNSADTFATANDDEQQAVDCDNEVVIEEVGMEIDICPEGIHNSDDSNDALVVSEDVKTSDLPEIKNQASSSENSSDNDENEDTECPVLPPNHDDGPKCEESKDLISVHKNDDDESRHHILLQKTEGDETKQQVVTENNDECKTDSANGKVPSVQSEDSNFFLDDDSMDSSDALVILEDEVLKVDSSDELSGDESANKSLAMDSSPVKSTLKGPIPNQRSENLHILTAEESQRLKNTDASVNEISTLPQDINMNIVKYRKIAPENSSPDEELHGADSTFPVDVRLKIDISKESTKVTYNKANPDKSIVNFAGDAKVLANKSPKTAPESVDKTPNAIAGDASENIKDDTKDVKNVAKTANSSPPVEEKPTIITSKSTARKSFVSTPVANEVLKPFDHGWRRELVYRASSCDSPSGKKQADVYYYTPHNNKLRSMPEILAYIQRNPSEGGNLTKGNFSFSKFQIYHAPMETVRNAKDAKVKTVPRAKVAKAPSFKSTSYELPDRQLPLKRKIKPINRDYPYLAPTKYSSSPVTGRYNGSHGSRSTVSEDDEKPPEKKSRLIEFEELKKPAVKKPRVKITPTLSDRQQPRPKQQEEEEKPGDPLLPEILESASSPVIAEDLLPLCSMDCPGQQNAAPSLLCCVCLCLFHPECVNYNPAHGPNLVCQRCLKGIKEGTTKAPLCVKDTLLDLLFPECSAKTKDSQGDSTNNNENSSSMPLSVANALSLQSVIHAPSPTVTSGSVNLPPPNVSLPLSIQKSSFLKKLSPKNSSPPASTASQTPSTSTSSALTNCLTGTLIFTNTQSPITNNQTVVNPPTTASPMLQVRLPAVNAPSPSLLAPPIIPNKLVPTSIAPNPNSKFILNMMPDNGGGVRYVLSPVDNSVPRIAAPPIPSFRDVNGEKSDVKNSPPKMGESITATALATNGKSKKYLVDRQLKRRAVIGQKNSFFSLQCGFTSFMEIFKYLSVTDLLRCGQVSKTWKELANQPMLWQSVSLNKIRVNDWQQCAHFLSKRGTTYLNLAGISSADQHTMWRDFLCSLRYFGSLEVLIFNQVTSSVLLAVADQLVGLEVLSATDIFDITQFGGNCYLDVSKLQHLQFLRQVRLHSSSGITVPSSSFTSLKFLKHLTVLSLTSFKGLTSENIFFLKLLPYVQELEIGECTLFDAQAYETISSMMSLRKLKLEVTGSSSDTIADCLVKLPGLLELGLILTTVSGRVAQSFKRLTKLNKLTLWPSHNEREQSYTNIHKVLSSLKNLSKLQWGIVVGDNELSNKEHLHNSINSVNIKIPFYNIDTNAVEAVTTKTLLASLRQSLPSTTVNIMFAPSTVAYRVSRMSPL